MSKILTEYDHQHKDLRRSTKIDDDTPTTVQPK